MDIIEAAEQVGIEWRPIAEKRPEGVRCVFWYGDRHFDLSAYDGYRFATHWLPLPATPLLINQGDYDQHEANRGQAK